VVANMALELACDPERSASCCRCDTGSLTLHESARTPNGLRGLEHLENKQRATFTKMTAAGKKTIDQGNVRSGRAFADALAGVLNPERCNEVQQVRIRSGEWPIEFWAAVRQRNRREAELDGIAKN